MNNPLFHAIMKLGDSMKEYNKLLELIDKYKYNIENTYEEILKDLKYDLLLQAKDAYIKIVNVNTRVVLSELDLTLKDYFNNKLVKDLRNNIKEYTELLKDQLEWAINNYGNTAGLIDSVNKHSDNIKDLFENTYPEVLKGILKNNFNKVGNRNISVPNILINIKKLNLEFSNIIDKLSLIYSNRVLSISIHDEFINKLKAVELDKIVLDEKLPDYLDKFQTIIKLSGYIPNFRNRILYLEKDNKKYRCSYDYNTNTITISDGLNSMIKVSDYEELAIDNVKRIMISKNNDNITIEDLENGKKIIIIKSNDGYNVANKDLEIITDKKEALATIDSLKKKVIGCYNLLMSDDNFLRQYNEEKDDLLFKNIPNSKIKDYELEMLKKDPEVQRYIELEEKK